MAIEKLKRHKSPGIDHTCIPAEMIEAGGRKIRSEIHEIINSLWNKEKLPEKWMWPIILSISTKVDKKRFSYYRGISRLLIT
jgi:hypothetical protein